MNFKKLFVVVLIAVLFTGCSLDPYVVSKTITKERRTEIESQLATIQTELQGVVELQKQVDSLVKQGILYRELGDYRSAEKSYLKIFNFAPNYYLARHNLAVVYEEVNDQLKALEQYHFMYAENKGLPEKAEAVDKVVTLSLRSGNVPEAERMLNSFAADYAADTQAKNLIISLRGDIERVRNEQITANNSK